MLLAAGMPPGMFALCERQAKRLFFPSSAATLAPAFLIIPL